MEKRIVCLFNRSFTEGHKIKNRIHLECKISMVDMDYDLKNKKFVAGFGLGLEKYYQDVLNCESEFLYVFNVNRMISLDDRNFEYSSSEHGNYTLTFYTLSIEELLGPLVIEDYKLNKNSEVLENIFLKFKHDNDTNSSVESLLERSIFIFNGVIWSNVVLKFKFHGIDISGGGTTNRHVLSENAFKLSFILNTLKSKMDINLINNIKKNKKEFKLKNSVPLDIYQKILDLLNSFKPSVLDRKPITKYFEDKNRDFGDLDFNNLEDYLIYNLYLCYLDILDNIKKLTDSNLIEISNSILKLEKESEELTKEIYSLENFIPRDNQYSGVKGNKMYKKERTKMIQNHDVSKIKELEEKRLVVQSTLEATNLNFNKKKEYYSKLTNNLGEFTISELIQIYNNNLNLGNSKQSKSYKNRFFKSHLSLGSLKSNINHISNSKANFSTYSVF